MDKKYIIELSAILFAIIAGSVWLGNLDGKISSINPDAIKKERIAAINDIKKELKSFEKERKSIVSSINNIKGSVSNNLLTIKNIEKKIESSTTDDIKKELSSSKKELESISSSIQALKSKVESNKILLKQDKCEYIGSTANDGALTCPVGWYVSGAKNSSHRNDTIELILCCQP